MLQRLLTYFCLESIALHLGVILSEVSLDPYDFFVTELQYNKMTKILNSGFSRRVYLIKLTSSFKKLGQLIHQFNLYSEK